MAGILCHSRLSQNRRSRRSAKHKEAFTHERSQRQSAASDPRHGSRAGRIGVGPFSPRYSAPKTRPGSSHPVRNKWHAVHCPRDCAASAPSQCRAQVHLGDGGSGLVDMDHGYLRGSQFLVGNDSNVVYCSKSGRCDRRRTMARTRRQTHAHRRWIRSDHRVGAAYRRFSEASFQHRIKRCVRPSN